MNVQVIEQVSDNFIVLNRAEYERVGTPQARGCYIESTEGGNSRPYEVVAIDTVGRDYWPTFRRHISFREAQRYAPLLHRN